MLGVVCGLCSKFHEQSARHDKYFWTKAEDQCSHVLRFCPWIAEYTHLSFTSCEEFTPTSVFFCIPNNCYVKVSDCTEQQQAGFDPFCPSCFQGEMVTRMIQETERMEK